MGTMPEQDLSRGGMPDNVTKAVAVRAVSFLEMLENGGLSPEERLQGFLPGVRKWTRDGVWVGAPLGKAVDAPVVSRGLPHSVTLPS